MNSVENYDLRYLEPKDLDQYNALLRYTFQVTEDELIATGWKDEEIKQSKFPVLERADVLGCFDGDTLISQFAVYPLKMNIYGEVFQVGFVTSVCTYPEYTGQGIMKKLMIQSLTHMKQQEKSFALLYPYSIPLYHHLGWEIISNKISFNIKDRQIPTKVKAPGYVRRVAWDSSDFHELHSHFASITHGCLFRNALAWEEYWRWDEDDTNVAVYYNTKDKPCGFMVYLIKNDIMHIKEMIYLNREAKKGLWELMKYTEIRISANQSLSRWMMGISKNPFVRMQWEESLISKNFSKIIHVIRTVEHFTLNWISPITFCLGMTVFSVCVFRMENVH